MKYLLVTLSLATLALTSACSNITSKRSALLEDGKGVLGSALTATLQSVVQQEATGGKIDLASAAAAGVWGAATSQATASTVRDVIASFSADTLPKTANASAVVFDSAVAKGVPPDKAASAIANVISSTVIDK